MMSNAVRHALTSWRIALNCCGQDVEVPSGIAQTLIVPHNCLYLS